MMLTTCIILFKSCGYILLKPHMFAFTDWSHSLSLQVSKKKDGFVEINNSFVANQHATNAVN